MSSFIGLGIVLKNNDDVLKEIENALIFLEDYSDNVFVTFPKDGDYEDWKTEDVDSFSELLEKLSYRTSYADMEIQLGNDVFETRLSLTNEEDEWLLKLEIDDQDVYQSRNFEDLERVTNVFTTFIESLDRVVNHAYIFCDTEAEYVYKASRILELPMIPYALLKMKDRKIMNALWYLDGQTERTVTPN